MPSSTSSHNSSSSSGSSSSSDSEHDDAWENDPPSPFLQQKTEQAAAAAAAVKNKEPSLAAGEELDSAPPPPQAIPLPTYKDQIMDDELNSPPPTPSPKYDQDSDSDLEAPVFSPVGVGVVGDAGDDLKPPPSPAFSADDVKINTERVDKQECAQENDNLQPVEPMDVDEVDTDVKPVLPKPEPEPEAVSPEKEEKPPQLLSQIKLEIKSEKKNEKNDMEVDLDSFCEDDDTFLQKYLEKSFPTRQAVDKLRRIGRVLKIPLPLPAIKGDSSSSSPDNSSSSDSESDSDSSSGSDSSYKLSGDDEKSKAKIKQTKRKISGEDSDQDICAPSWKKKKLDKTKIKLPIKMESFEIKSKSSKSRTKRKTPVLKSTKSSPPRSKDRDFRRGSSSSSSVKRRSPEKSKSKSKSSSNNNSRSSSSSSKSKSREEEKRREKERERRHSSDRRSSSSSSSSRRHSSSSSSTSLEKDVQHVMEKLLDQVCILNGEKIPSKSSSSSSSHSKSVSSEREKYKSKSSSSSSSRDKERERRKSDDKSHQEKHSSPEQIRSKSKHDVKSFRKSEEKRSPNRHLPPHLKKKTQFQQQPLIRRPKKDNHDLDSKFHKTFLSRNKEREKYQLHPEKVSTSSADCSAVPIVFKSFKIPKKKPPILKSAPGVYIPNEEPSEEIRDEENRKVKFTLPEDHREDHPKKKRREVERDRPRKIVTDASLLEKELKDKDKKKIEEADSLFFPDVKPKLGALNPFTEVEGQGQDVLVPDVSPLSIAAPAKSAISLEPVPIPSSVPLDATLVAVSSLKHELPDIPQDEEPPARSYSPIPEYPVYRPQQRDSHSPPRRDSRSGPLSYNSGREPVVQIRRDRDPLDEPPAFQRRDYRNQHRPHSSRRPPHQHHPNRNPQTRPGYHAASRIAPHPPLPSFTPPLSPGPPRTKAAVKDFGFGEHSNGIVQENNGFKVDENFKS